MNKAQELRKNYENFYENDANDMVSKILIESEKLSKSGKNCYEIEYREYPLRNVVINKLRLLGFDAHITGRSNEKIYISWECS